MRGWLNGFVDRFIVNRARRYPPTLPESEMKGEGLIPTYYLTIATIVKNEGSYIQEWLEFHRLLGVEKFIIYDNGSTDDTCGKLSPYVNQGYVTVIPWRHFDTMRNTQLLAYAHALSNFGYTTKWMGFFDIDEFVFTTKYIPLNIFLKNYEDIPALGVIGLFFSSSGHEFPPKGLVIENYTHSVPFEKQVENNQLLHVKCFVQPTQVSSPGVHFCQLKNSNARYYTEHKKPILAKLKKSINIHSVDLIRYNHYYLKSKLDMREKYEKGRVGGNFDILKRRNMIMKKYEIIESLKATDETVFPYVRLVKEALSELNKNS
jgi:hypothetical protein